MKIIHAIVVTSVLSAGLSGCAEIKRQSAIGAKKLVKILEDDLKYYDVNQIESILK